MLLMIKNHLNGTWFYELLKCYFRVHSKFTQCLYMRNAPVRTQLKIELG